jgi:hypothetical protein
MTVDPAKGVNVGVTPAPPDNRGTDRSSERPLEVILLTEERDENQMVAEMRGEIADSYVYSFQQGNRTITNLAYPGVKEAIRRRGNDGLLHLCDERIGHGTLCYCKVHGIEEDRP